MQKNWKRKLALLVTSVMVVGSSYVMAEGAVKEPYSEDFSSFVSEDVSPVSSVKFNNCYPETDISHFTPVKGLATKDKSDTAIMINSKEADYSEYINEDGTFKKSGLTHPNVDVMVDSGDFNSGEKIHVSFEMINFDYNIRKYVTMKVKSQHQDGTLEDTHFPHGNGGEIVSMNVVNGKPQICFFGSSYANYQYNLGEWYKIDIFFDKDLQTNPKVAGTELYAANANLYINGKLVYKDYGYNPANANVSALDNSVLKSIESLRFQQQPVKLSGNTYCSGSFAFDNIYTGIVNDSTMPVLAETPMPNYAGFEYAAPDQDYSARVNNGDTYARIHNAMWFGNYRNPEDTRFPVFEDGSKTGTVRFDVPSGMFGRAADDKSLYIYNPQQYFPDTTTDKGAFQYCSSGYVQINPGAAQMGDLKPGDQFRMSFALARDEDSTKTRISTQTRFVDSDGVNNTNAKDIFKVDKAADVAVFDQSIGLNMATNRWYRFDIICTVGQKDKVANIADVYVNGSLAKQGIEFSASGNVEKNEDGTIKSVKQVKSMVYLRPGYSLDNANKTGNTKVATDGKTYEEYQHTGWYFDDVGYETYMNGNKAKTPAVLTGEGFKADSQKISWFDSSMTVGEFLNNALVDGVSVANGADLKVVNSDGIEVDSLAKLEGNIVAINSNTREPIFLSAVQKVMVLQDNYNKDVADNTSPSGDQASLVKIGGDYYTWASTSVSAAGGGKPEDNKAFYIKMKDYKGQKELNSSNGGNDPFIDYNKFTMTRDTTVEVSLRGPIASPEGAKNGAANFAVGYDGKTPDSVAELRPDRKIRLNGKDVGTWEPNQWYKFAVTYYIGTNRADYYLNGELIEKNAVIMQNGKERTEPVDYIFRLKLVNAVYDGSEENPVGNITAYDDLKIYEGAYSPAADQIEVTSYADRDYTSPIVIDNVNGKIHVPAGTSYRTFFEDVLVNGDAANSDSLFTDNSFTALQTGTVKAGNVFAPISANGETLKYYEITNDPFVGDVLVNDAPVSNLTDGVLKATANVKNLNSGTVMMVIAQYKGNQMVQAAVSAALSKDGALEAQMEVSDAANSKVKIMFVDSLGSIMPYGSAVTVNP